MRSSHIAALALLALVLLLSACSAPITPAVTSLAPTVQAATPTFSIGQRFTCQAINSALIEFTVDAVLDDGWLRVRDHSSNFLPLVESPIETELINSNTFWRCVSL